jgi:serine/threonine protein kinase
VALAPDEETPSPTNLSTGVHLGPLDDARFAPGRIFASRYRIVSLLGQGAMGEVYRADDLRLGQAVALKLMSEAVARRHDRLQRFADEVRLARTIVHPNVCRVYDIGHAEGWYYLSMEYVDGETLASLMRRIGQLPMSKALDMARQLCAGVGAAHDRGVLHRDLKPSNIMVDGRGQIRIMDFGLAIAAHADVREVAGTPGYMAPEQVAGGPVTTKADLYALGRVLTEILPARVDPEVTTAIRACLDPNPARRPDSAYELLHVIALPAALTASTPTPAMVAATPITGAMQPLIAWLLLFSAIVGSAAVAWRAQVFNVCAAQVPKPPEVLADRAREILKETRAGTEPAVDRAYWFWADQLDDSVRFTYRESSKPLVPANLFRVVTASDPPLDSKGQAMVTLEADGSPSSNTPPPGNPLSTGRSRPGEAILLVGVLLFFLTGSVLARRNLRAGEGDRKGAQRLAVVVCCGSMLGGVLRAHHVASVSDELSWLLSAAGWSLLWGGFSWLVYLSFERYVRRLWPGTLISWTRMLTGRLQDPLVGAMF